MNNIEGFMSQSAFKLESLLETHDLPFVIINAELKIVAVNRAWEACFGVSRQNMVGQSCCINNGDCRHKRLFQTLEPYAGIFPATRPWAERKFLNVRGYPLLDADGTLYLGESLTVVSKSGVDSDNEKMVGQCPKFSALKTRLQQAAETQAPVLLMGETGTGKELAAEFVHRHSKNAQGEFVIADCTIFSEDLFESEMFGHEKGAFTGAVAGKKGLFELANHGTLFLDEIGELPLSQQPKLLRALESGQFRRVGGTATLKSTVRVVCATHRNLEEMVKQGRFREDLFYRLSVFPIEIPPLRDRRQDLPLLVDHFLAQFDQGQYALTQAALIKLLQHTWPGNIRELRNCLQLATGLCKDHQIQESDINFIRRQVKDANPDSVERSVKEENGTSGSMTALERFEADFIASLIVKYQGNRKLIAAEMNISERTLYRKLNRLNLN
ncbi:MAG: sigma-54 interaction domain-containing protein [Methylomonas sp.]